jgi:hypothetical protein
VDIVHLCLRSGGGGTQRAQSSCTVLHKRTFFSRPTGAAPFRSPTVLQQLKFWFSEVTYVLRELEVCSC